MEIKKPYIGQMDRKIKVYSIDKVQNEVGEEKEERVLIASPWAMLSSDSGSERVDGNVRHESNKKFTIRYNSKIAKQGNEFVIEYNGLDYGITHVVEIGRRSHLQLICFSYV